MAARKRAVKLPEEWREKIQATKIMQRLQDHAVGKVEMTATQVKAADILLKKVIPDLNRMTVAGADDAPPVKMEISWMS